MQKTSKDHAPGIAHVGIKYLPPMADETVRHYPLVAIDRAMRCAYLRIHADNQFNGRISDILTTTRFRLRKDLQITSECYVKLYNQHLPQRAIGHTTLLQAMRAWREQWPDLLVRQP